MKLLFVVVVGVFAFVTCGAEESVGPIVETSLGRILGSTKTSMSGRTFMAFTGLPYAEKPLRFQVEYRRHRICLKYLMFEFLNRIQYLSNPGQSDLYLMELSMHQSVPRRTYWVANSVAKKTVWCWISTPIKYIHMISILTEYLNRVS